MKNIRNGILILMILNSASAFSKGGPKITPEEYKKLKGGNYTTKIGDKWVVPKAVGLDFDKDLKTLQIHLQNFKVGKVNRVADSQPKGIIISQSPKEATLVDTVGSINVVVSDGQKN
ncbi:MAG: PASTA domain-containing protein [Proteobacteria bacterium]|nr:MAG: PASTA domain-containing protein [Pseudomonadota bacterium]